MPKNIWAFAFLIFGIQATYLNAQQYVIRVEDYSRKQIEVHGSWASGGLDNIRDEGHAAATLEVHARSGEKFCGKTKVGNTVLEFRGKLDEVDSSGRLRADIRTSVTHILASDQGTGSNGAISSATDKKKYSGGGTFEFEVGKPVFIGSSAIWSNLDGVPSIEAKIRDNRALFVTVDVAEQED